MSAAVGGSRRSIHWTDEMVATLLEMRAAGHAIAACAVRIGVHHSVARRKAHELGIAARLRSGPKLGAAMRCGAGRQ